LVSFSISFPHEWTKNPRCVVAPFLLLTFFMHRLPSLSL
jgi:hypothetical protein